MDFGQVVEQVGDRHVEIVVTVALRRDRLLRRPERPDRSLKPHDKARMTADASRPGNPVANGVGARVSYGQ